MSSHQEREGIWQEYLSARHIWYEKENQNPEIFSLDVSQRSYRESISCPMPCIDCWPTLTLPLRLHLCRDETLTPCTLTRDQCLEMLSRANFLWQEARIHWHLVDVVEEYFSHLDVSTKITLRERIWSLGRGADGKMANKDFRREMFLGSKGLIPNHHAHSDAFDVYYFDYVGNESQGCCISRDSRTVIMGQRSTKGYDIPTSRPLHCLGKTTAHEIGHALHLNHPAGRKFKNRVSVVSTCYEFGDKANLMTGGKDSTGGGGEHLEKWQIVGARRCAEVFLNGRQCV